MVGFRAALPLLATAAAAPDGGLLNLLFMADIGHPREHFDQLTQQWPMGKCAYEGAFSLYEGLYDYVTRQSARPSAVVVMGDVAYGGGEPSVNNNTRKAFQRYLNGVVPEDRVFVAIGNHDVHFLGCTALDLGTCYYGASTQLGYESAWQMTFEEWRASWTTYFPGLTQSAISPSRQSGGRPWRAPSRYNLNLDAASSVYIIAGLASGSGQLNWNKDTPTESQDGILDPSMECAFLRDSLAHGRSLGKTVFVYWTHHFAMGCDDWDVIQQVDVWMYGHKHNFWQSAAKGETVVQDSRHYPTKVLIGNGGFDEAHIDVVSFGHVTEEVIANGSRVRLNFKVFDTCVSDQACPDGIVNPSASCWKRCKDFPGGFDNGGGPRMATPSLHGGGFVFEAPRRPPAEPQPAPRAPHGGSWKIMVSSSEEGAAPEWLAVAACFGSHWLSSVSCLVPVGQEAAASIFTIYDAHSGEGGHHFARLAVDNRVRAPVLAESPQRMLSEERAARRLAAAQGEVEASGEDFAALELLASAAGPVLYQPGTGFWDIRGEGTGMMRPSDGHVFTFTEGAASWSALGVGWVTGGVFGSRTLSLVEGSALDVKFVFPGALEVIV